MQGVHLGKAAGSGWATVKSGLSVWLLLGMLTTTPSVLAASVEGKVVNVHDGDTVTLLTKKNQTIKVRLGQIDAPEIGQAYGQSAKRSLSRLVSGRRVRLDKETTDRYGRTVGTLWLGDKDINREQIKLGMAWVYRQYLHDRSLLELEESARKRRIGLWSERNPTPPWQFGRRGEHTPSSSNRSSSLTCGRKRYCKDMSSCDEAKNYWERCGLSQLDRDKDGVPCESLCK